MPLNPDQFASQLKRRLPHICLVAGDEPLLVQEAADDFRAAARDQGFDEREVLHVEAGFDWNQLATASASLSLFASRRRIEIHLGDKSPGKPGSEALVQFAENPQEDVVLLVIANSLDKSARSSKWFKVIESSGAACYAWPVKGGDFLRWIDSRLRAAGLNADRDVVHWLGARTEGNLLACKQEITKLSLLCPDGQLSLDAAESAVADHARYDAFDFVDKALAGKAASAIRSLWRLREEGEEPLGILGSMTWTLRGLEKVAIAVECRGNMETAFREARVWGPKRKLFEAAARRLGSAGIYQALQLAASVDKASKGMSGDSAWEELVKLTACLVQAPLPGVAPAFETLRVSAFS